MRRGGDRARNRARNRAVDPEIVKLTLTGMAPTGEAIGRHAGMVVFVPFGLPGEDVRVRLVERRRSFARGEIVERLVDAPVRVGQVCPYFGRCGGCDWQHIAYDEQLRIKTAIVVEQLARIGRLVDPPVWPCVGSPAAYEYRNHARLHVTAAGEPGYRARRSHSIVAVADCPILEPALRRQLSSLAESCAIPPDAGELELRSWGDVAEVAGFSYFTGEGAFFQANTAVAGLLVESVLAALAPRGSERVLDLYCGVGLFTVPVGQRVAQIVGVESGSTAAADAVRNLAAAGVPGRILAQDVAEALLARTVTQQPWDAILLDPPRTGVDAGALQALIALGSPRLIYISCEPATLARDLRILVDRGYRLQWVQPYDMFPQTRHVETLAVLSLPVCQATA
jgi:23S rRNA (uracil1939-C5)-methyltransferase